MGSATLSLNDFEELTDAVFGFLVRDHSYAALPAERSGRFGSAFIRRFQRGNLEIGVGFGDADSDRLCQVWFKDDLNQELARNGYVSREIATLLVQRNPAFVHPTSEDLSRDATPETVKTQYARMLRDFAADVVEGDYSPFPTLVYVLNHVDRQDSGDEVRRLLGVYSSYQSATGAIDERRSKPGFSERPGGFEIWRVELDGYGFWYAGIPLDSKRQW